MRPVSAVNPKVKMSTYLSMPISPVRGMSAGIAATSKSMPHIASNSPAAPPRVESSRLSVSNWRTTRQRLAPRAVRMAISLRRTVARASIRFATLAQAINSTKATAASSTSRAGRTLPTNLSWAETRAILKPVSASGYCASSRLAIVLTSAWPCLRRPTTFRKTAPLAMRAASGRLEASGIQKST